MPNKNVPEPNPAPSILNLNTGDPKKSWQCSGASGSWAPGCKAWLSVEEPACFLCARHFFDFVWCWSPGLTASGALVWGRGCALRRSQGVGFLGFASIRLGFGSVALDFKSGVRRTRLRSWQEFWYLCAAASMNEECWYACQDVGCHVLCVLM